MKAASVRLGGITIYNFKNVLEGSLSFINTRKTYKASIVGLYGQNGSGKTALIDALELLKYVLCGRTIPEKFAEYINVDSESATLVYQFIVTTSEESFIVSYQFSIQSAQDVSEQNINSIQSTEHRKRVRIYNELLKCPILGEKKIRIGKLIDTDTSQVFLPNPKRLLLIGNDRKIDTDLQVAKKLTSVQSRSFVFSSELLGAIRNVVSKSVNSKRNFSSMQPSSRA